MKPTTRSIAILVITTILMILVSATDAAVFSQTALGQIEMYGAELVEPRNDEITDDQIREIQDAIRANLESLANQGRLLPITEGPVRFSWPTAKASGLRDFHVGNVSYFVDHDLAFPNQLLDWNCGIRTYDRDTGINHTGTDISSVPFPWRRMDNNEVYAVAAAPGMIVLKRDGNFDRSCSVNTNPANAVFVVHSDGSVTWYFHLKNGSLTTKEVGDMVAAGEYLGVTGSSGSSQLPHLHFQVYNAGNELQDPYSGPCNSLNNFSWWADQDPYRVSRINTLTTGSAAPVFPACPQQEITNEKIVFEPGDTIVTTSYYRDQLLGHETAHSILRPDGSAFVSWLHVSPADYNLLRYWFRTWQLPTDASTGEWTYRAEYNGQMYETRFYVGQPPNVSVTGRVTTLSGRPVYGATVVLSREGAASRTSRTNPFGYYRFDDVPVGETFNVNVTAKALSFHSRVVTIGGELHGFDHFSLNDY
jgi:hypothetical protein